MAFPTEVNSQITDSVTQVNTRVIGETPAVAVSNFMIATSQALQNAAHNATSPHQQSIVTAQAALTQGVSTLYSIDAASTASGTSGIYRKTGSSNRAVSADNIIGAVYAKTASPAGKQDLARAVSQANEKPNDKYDVSTLSQLQGVIEAAISDALNSGLSKQSVAHHLIGVLEEHKISMLLYPFETEGKTITEEDIQNYYSEIVDAYYLTQDQLLK